MSAMPIQMASFCLRLMNGVSFSLYSNVARAQNATAHGYFPIGGNVEAHSTIVTIRAHVAETPSSRMLSRRRVLKQWTIGATSAVALAGAETVAHPPLSAEDDAFLEEVEKAGFLYFWEQADPHTGLVKDRCNTTVSADKGVVASIAATGFGLTALCIGHKRGYGSSSAITLRVVSCLD